MAQMPAILRQRNCGLLWLAGLVSLVGDWVLVGALPFYVYEQSGPPLATAGRLVALSLPHVLLGSVAGVFVDRWDRRRTMIARLARWLAPARMLALCLGLAGVTLQTILHFPYLAGVLPLVAAIGFPAVGMNASSQALLQGAAPEAYRGRVLGAFAATQMLLRLAGYAAGGATGDAFGVIPVLEGAYCLWLVAAPLVVLLVRQPQLGRSRPVQS